MGILYLLNLKDSKWNEKPAYRIYRELDFNQAAL
jgi:hypothetical protein